MEAFIASFLQYLIIMIILIGIAVLGVVLGIKWRKAKNAKLEAETVEGNTAADTDK